MYNDTILNWACLKNLSLWYGEGRGERGEGRGGGGVERERGERGESVEREERERNMNYIFHHSDCLINKMFSRINN